VRTLALALGLALVLGAGAQARAPKVKPSAEPEPAAAPDSGRAEIVRKLWKLGLGYFASGDAELARVQWSACAELDPENEECRQALKGLDHVSLARTAPAVEAAPPPRVPLKPLPRFAPAKPSGKARVPAAPSTVALAPAQAPALAPSGRVMGAQEAELRARAAADRREREALQHQAQGLAAVARGEFDKAREEFSACVSINPKEPECASSLIRLTAVKPPAGERNSNIAAGTAPSTGAAAPVKDAPAPVVVSADARRAAVHHWNEGIGYFQRGDFAKAKQEWSQCSQSDPTNLDCQTGLQRIDLSGGGR
jgi:Tfp pilus assembly protein PilF